MSFDGGEHWNPLSLNLPRVRVSDIAIQSAQHAVVLATHGRAFWVLDNLQFLEQLGKAQLRANEPHLFAPQQTWLVNRSTGRPSPTAGENKPVGATVFFHLPANYDGHSTVKLSFTTAGGKLIRSFTLSPTAKELSGPKALRPGMNRFQWNLRYPDAVRVTGFIVPAGTGPDNDTSIGPKVMPGTYFAVLDYDGTTLKQAFKVQLDPRLSTTSEELKARFDVLMRIHELLGCMDGTLDQAIAIRSRLREGIARGGSNDQSARVDLDALNRDIGHLVQLKIQSSEGDVVYEPQIRDRLVRLTHDIETNFLPLRPVQSQGYTLLSAEAEADIRALQADIVRAQTLR